MSLNSPTARLSISYSNRIAQRAEIALSCSPFQLNLFTNMVNQSVPLPSIAHQTGLQKKYTKKILSETQVENELTWLINVGLLRREVDGQGLTDSFRLTPLGRQIVAKWQAQGKPCSSPSVSKRLINLSNRWFRLPL